MDDITQGLMIISMSNNVERTEELMLKEKYLRSGMLATWHEVVPSKIVTHNLLSVHKAWDLGALCTICVTETRPEPLLDPYCDLDYLISLQNLN